jgi:hypothetical protein
MDGIRSTSVLLLVHSFLACFLCVADGVCRYFLDCFLYPSAFAYSSASSSCRYIVATFPSFRRSTAKRLICCGVVLLARLDLYLNFMPTSMWSESVTSEKCRPSNKHWPSGECQVSRWIRLCMKYVLLIVISLPAAKSINRRPSSADTIAENNGIGQLLIFLKCLSTLNKNSLKKT